jgi:hypothetical protein
MVTLVGNITNRTLAIPIKQCPRLLLQNAGTALFLQRQCVARKEASYSY